MINVLVTGVGAIIGYGIIESLRTQSKYEVRIVGMDIYDDCYGQFVCDKFYIAKPAYSDEYLPFIQKLVADEDIDIIMPGIEQDMYRLYQLRDKIETTIVFNNELLINISKDKLASYSFFKEKGLTVIPTLYMEDYETYKRCLGLPFLLKPRTSYASKGIYKISTEEELNFYNKDPKQNIFQHIIGSIEEEYTVSIFGLADGTFADSIILRRKLAQTGATDKATVLLDDADIMNYVSEICKITQPIGPTNIQLRKDNGKVYLLEINPRISSACSIRCKAGYNEPLMCIDYYLKGLRPTISPKAEIRAVRFISDYIYE